MVLERWLKRHPEATLRTLTMGDEKELWATLEVRGTPTLLLENRDTRRTTVLRGFTTEVQLEEAASNVSQPKEKSRDK